MSNRPTTKYHSLSLILLLVMQSLLGGCGEQRTGQITTPPPTVPWLPPPINPACPSGDLDGDGACDINETANGFNPLSADSDNDGELDGLESQTASGGGGGSNSWDSQDWRSAMLWAVGSIVVSSLAFNVIRGSFDCEQHGFLGLYCVRPNWKNATVTFQSTSPQFGWVYFRFDAEVDQKAWWYYRFNLPGGSGTKAHINYRLKYKLTLPASQPPGTDTNFDKPFYYFKDVAEPGPSNGDINQPAVTQMQLFGTQPDGSQSCDGKKLKQGATGAEVSFDDGSHEFCLHDGFFDNNEGVTNSIKTGFQVLFGARQNGTITYDTKYLTFIAKPGERIHIPTEYLRITEFNSASAIDGEYGLNQEDPNQ